MAAYLIQSETLAAIANQARRLANASGRLTPAQIASALGEVTAGGGGGSYNDDYDTLRFSPRASSFREYGGNGGWEDAYSISAPFSNIAEVRMPSCTELSDGYFDTTVGLRTGYFPNCTYVGMRTFKGCATLESLTLNSGCDIYEEAFTYVLSPNDKTFRLYLRGNTVGTCSPHIFDLGSGSCGYAPAYDYSQPVPGFEVYVPANLLNTFKTQWAGGIFAGNIYALTD